MSFRLVEAERAQHPVSLLCNVLGVTRAGYYGWRKRGRSPRQRRDGELKRLVATVFADSHESYGAPRIQAELADDYGLRVSRKRVARLMRELGIQGVSRRRKGLRTTARAKEAPAATDLVRRRFRSSGRDRLWVADITYVPSWQGYVFLACVLDAWSRKVVGWSMRDDLRAELALDALAMALARRRPAPGLVHHSDRGSQYTSLAFGKTLSKSGVLASMGRRGDAVDNAVCEAFFATLETELIDRHTFRTRDEARLALFQWIEGFYNPKRRHSALGQRSPDRFEQIMINDDTQTAVAVSS
jgi:putative transposase